MAILNVKNFPGTLYERLRTRARLEHRSIAQEVIHLLTIALDHGSAVSVLSIRGTGRGLYGDAAAHVERERGSWD
jgi:plasmid stability protein